MSIFRENVLEIVRGIPVGQTYSYKQVAKLAGNPRAARAVANIMAANYDLTIPCHRVIRSNGSFGGYNRGGNIIKRAILESERLMI